MSVVKEAELFAQRFGMDEEPVIQFMQTCQTNPEIALVLGRLIASFTAVAINAPAQASYLQACRNFSDALALLTLGGHIGLEVRGKDGLKGADLWVN